jgi:outer membrane protein OmpA-like peptidoglycan-associated protein
MKARALPLLVALLCALGCASAYDQAYQQETQRLEAEEAARQEQERAAHAEASRYAAVVYFGVNSAVIDEAGYRELRWLVEQLLPYPQAMLEVQGFADATGGEEHNQQLSEQRAERVARYLVTQGIDPERIRVTGFSENFPARANETAQGRNRNRRVEVTVR